jgi:hypothetical protein
MAGDQIAYPEWTDYCDKSGLDPFGMQNSSINLHQRLLPGICNVTLRIRYYGFYAWLVAVYARRSRSIRQCMPRRFCGNGSEGSLLPPSLILIICARRIARLTGISRWLA